MKLIWERIAKEQLKEVAKYIRVDFGVKREKIFQQEISHATRMLLLNPYMGALDPLFSERTIAYRSILVNRLNKMVYYVDDNEIIHISAFWDCRRNPETQAKLVK